MKNLFLSIKNLLKRFLFPDPAQPRWKKLFPYITLGVITLILIVSTFQVWNYTNSNQFCGTFCHTMPPQLTTTLASPHARVDCVECHLGRADLPTRVVRKVEDGWLTFSAMVTKNFEYPITAHNMRPANEACETCHYPQKFSTDTMVEINHFANDYDNTSNTTYLVLKTGGGSEREGLGFGIHWHIENPVYYIALDKEKTEIPYVRVQHKDGTITEYVDIETYDPSMYNEEVVETMDCISCHNRTSHMIASPGPAVDDLLQRNLISIDIPFIKKNATEVLGNEYVSTNHAMQGIAVLEGYYEQYFPEFYKENSELVTQAIDILQETYRSSVFPEQEMDWESHPDHIGHNDDPGCFRCHDGKHLNPKGDAVRLECNLCHSIPVIAGPGDLIAEIEFNRGVEPPSHLHANWIAMHSEILDETCQNCHTMDDPGGISDTSFCSNSACHGVNYEYAGFDAPELRNIILQQIEEFIIPPQPELVISGPITYSSPISTILQNKCSICHGEGGSSDFNVTNYESLLAGGENGPAVIPNDPENSPLLMKGTADHYASFTPDEITLITEWISTNSPE